MVSRADLAKRSSLEEMAATLPLALDVATLERVVLRPDPPFTDGDFFDFCTQHELLRIERNAEGEIVIMAPAGFDSNWIAFEIAAELRSWTKKDGGGIVAAAEAGITLPDGSVFSPDACWIPMQRWKAIPLDERKRFPSLVPAFVVEVRSPSDRMKDLPAKMLVYLRNGVEMGWLIDPKSRTVSIYKTGPSSQWSLTIRLFFAVKAR